MDIVRHYVNTRLDRYDTRCGSRTVLWHQYISAITFLELDNLKSMLGYFGTGSGKTIFGCYVIANLKQIYSNWSVYILVKKSLETVWRDELANMLTWDATEITNKIHIIPYDISTFHSTFFDIVKLKSFRDRSLFVIDESQVFISRCVNKDTQHLNIRKMRTTYDHIKRTINKNSDKLLLLSATPITNSIEEFKMYMGLLRPKMFDKVPLESFCRNEIIVAPKLIGKSMEMCCAAYNVQLTSALTSSPTSKSFAEKRVVVVEVEMSQHQKEIYTRADKQEKESKARGFRYLTRSICNFVYKFMDSDTKEYLSDEEIQRQLDKDSLEFISGVKTEELLLSCSPKFYKTCELIKLSKGKCMVYIDLTSRNGIPEFIEYLKFFQISYVEFSGRTSKTRDEDLVRFNNNKSNLHGEQIKVIIISAAGTEGITLTAVQDVYVLSLLWTDAVFQQLIGRSVRYNVHEDLPLDERLAIIQVMISTYPMYTTADEHMLKLIKHKYEMCSSVYKLFYDSSIDMSEETKGTTDMSKSDIEQLVSDIYNKTIVSDVNIVLMTKELKPIMYTYDDGETVSRGYLDNNNNLYNDSYVQIGRLDKYKIKINNKRPIYYISN
jgi:superfamily II DNA or RNA helicase